MSNYPQKAPAPYFIAAQDDSNARRTRIAIPAVLRLSGARGFQTVVHDLWLSGFCATAINRIHVGTLCWLTLPGLEALQGQVVWWENSLTGCAFEHLLAPIIHENILGRWQSDATLRPSS